ncbi:MAG: hypothetical protein Q8N23_16670 [Archangium sp.]|nr:hypothetical protein [Archangium sp.]MDP3569727.1 hypothetical protein [Archangium sp.]
MARVRLGRFPSSEGQLGRIALERESIEVELIGEQLSALQGVIPSSEVMVELWVEPDQLERARRVLSAALREQATKTGDVRCPSCGLSSPATFEVCWSCQNDLAAAEKLPETKPTPAKSRPPVFTLLLALSTIGLGVLLWQERQLPKIRPSRTSEWSWSYSQCLEQRVRDHLISRSCDRDDDDNFEQVDSFDAKGRLSSTSYDANEDGVFERTDSFDTKGLLVRRDFDLDDDWRTDRSDLFDQSERMIQRTVDREGDGRSGSTEGYDALGRVVKTSERDDDETWLLPGRQLRFRFSEKSGELAELIISTDAGVVKKQVLTIEGWRDQP